MAVVISATLLMSACTYTEPLAISSNPVGKKVGTSKGGFVFKVLAFGADYSIEKAARNGGITKISTVDVKTLNVLGIYKQKTTIVTGE